jgi:hypothetical protein
MVQNLENFKEGYSLKSKKLFAILTLVAFMITLVPVAAFAATTNTALTVPYVTTGTLKAMGTIRITETDATAGSFASGDQFTITLPSNVTYGLIPTTGAANITTGADVNQWVGLPNMIGTKSNKIIGAAIVNATNRSITVRVASVATDASRPAAFEIKFPAKMSISSGSGPVEADILDLSNKVTSGKVTVANLITAGSKISALNVASVSEGDKRAIGSLRVIEDAPGALASGNTITLTLPDYFMWDSTSAPAINVFSGNGTAVAVFTGLNTSGRDTLTLRSSGANATTIPGAFDVTGLKVNVRPDAPLGEVSMAIGGTNAGIQPSSLVAFKKVEYQTTISALNVPNLYAGQTDVKIGTIQIKEMAAGTIISGRTIRIDLPQNAVWQTRPSIENVTGTNGTTIINNAAGATLANSNRTLILSVSSSSTAASTFNIKDGKISIRGNSPVGDVKITLGGTSTVTGEVVAAKIAAPLEATTTPTTIKIGLQQQPASDIVIKEVAKELLKYSVGGIANQTLTLIAPGGVTFDVKPTVEVVSGDLKVNNDTTTVNGGTLTIPITQSSLVPGEIKISNVKLNVDRTVAEGPMTFGIRGGAINHYGVVDANYVADNVATVVVANVITPAPGDTKAESKVTFTIDSNMYTVGDAQKMMDVAPYIKSGRTYLPIRYVADALGVINDNIMWNDASQTVTIMKGERVIQLKIGSPVMKVQGTDVTMDVAPEIKDGRTMLPVRFVGQALGATIGYDEATQTVTIE